MTSAEEMLLDAAGRDGADLDSVIDHIGLPAIAQILVEEIVFRADLDDLVPVDTAVMVIITLTHRGEKVSTPILVGPGTVVVGAVVVGADEPSGIPFTTVVQDAAEVAGALFGPRERLSASTREIRWPEPDVVVSGRRSDGPLPAVFVAVVQRVTGVLDRNETADLSRLAVRHGTDKWGPFHQYTPHYQLHFAPFRDRRLTLLEIGVGGHDDPVSGGASLRMWRRFFPRALVYGIDIVDKHLLDEPRIVTVRADQSDPDSLRDVAERFGPFDIVIDDGSHVSAHVIAAFCMLFRYVRPEGLYVVEDLHGSFWPSPFSGSEDDLDDPAYTLGFLKKLVDGLHHEEFLKPETRAPQPSDTAIRGLHFYHNLCIVQKGPNREGSPGAELLRAAEARRSAKEPG